MINIKPILIEKNDEGSSGILIEEKYVLTTSSLLRKVFKGSSSELMKQIEQGKLHSYTRNTAVKFRISWKNEEGSRLLIISKTAHLFGVFKCANLSEFYKGWHSNVNLKETVTLFLILAVEGHHNVSQEDLSTSLRAWLHNTLTVNVNKGDEILCISSPFGSEVFLNSLSKGIVSTVLKESDALFLSDCSSAPGSEGGLVYAIKGSANHPVGIVISPFNWWRKEWVGFTLVADVRPIICQLVGLDLKTINNKGPYSLSRLFENCLAQINCGTEWGTGILLSKEKGIFLTNAHVVKEDLKIIRLSWKGNTAIGRLIYKTLASSAIDLALIKTDAYWSTTMTAPDLSIAQYEAGDAVYCAGYPLLSTVSKPEGITITQGVISGFETCMLQTSCAVYPGFSGGGVFNLQGVLLGVIVANTKLSNVSYPRHNMAIPFRAIADVIFEYLLTEDVKVLVGLLKAFNVKGEQMWRKIGGKL